MGPYFCVLKKQGSAQIMAKSLPSPLFFCSRRKGRTRAAVRPWLPGCTAGICRAGLGPCQGTCSPAAAHKACPCPAPPKLPSAQTSQGPAGSVCGAGCPDHAHEGTCSLPRTQPSPCRGLSLPQQLGAPALLESAPKNRPAA